MEGYKNDHSTVDDGNNVLNAIKLRAWDFEPKTTDASEYDSTEALPGTGEKLAVIAERVRRGLPLWHKDDRRTFDGSKPDED